jgi:hypothetical protein
VDLIRLHHDIVRRRVILHWNEPSGSISKLRIPVNKEHQTFFKNAFFWDVASCRRFGGKYSLHIEGRKIRERGTTWAGGCSHPEDGGIRSSETSVHTRSTRGHISEDGMLHSHRCENLKSYTLLFSRQRFRISARLSGVRSEAYPGRILIRSRLPWVSHGRLGAFCNTVLKCVWQRSFTSLSAQFIIMV